MPLDWLIHIGGFILLIGFLVRDQILLRGIVVLGLAVLLVYLTILNGIPSPSVAWLVALIVANAVMIFLLYRGQSNVAMTEDERELYAQLDGLNPGEFSRLMKVTDWVQVGEEMNLTVAGQRVDAMYFILRGKVLLERGGKHIVLGPKSFVGELGVLLGHDASATVIAMPGTTLARWEVNRYRRFMARSSQIKVVFDAILNRDMARKLRS